MLTPMVAVANSRALTTRTAEYLLPGDLLREELVEEAPAQAHLGLHPDELGLLGEEVPVEAGQHAGPEDADRDLGHRKGLPVCGLEHALGYGAEKPLGLEHQPRHSPVREAFDVLVAPLGLHGEERAQDQLPPEDPLGEIWLLTHRDPVHLAVEAPLPGHDSRLAQALHLQYIPDCNRHAVFPTPPGQTLDRLRPLETIIA
jgi:hypothetical protein